MMANYQSAFMNNSLKFAQKIERQFKRYSDRMSYGVKQAGFFFWFVRKRLCQVYWSK
jgi:N-acetylmuramoyl-L-alanine amidase